MPFIKGDPRINRKGAPHLTEEQKLARAARKAATQRFLDQLEEMLDVKKYEAMLKACFLTNTDTGEVTCLFPEIACRIMKQIEDRVLGKPTEHFEGDFTSDVILNIVKFNKQKEEESNGNDNQPSV